MDIRNNWRRMTPRRKQKIIRALIAWTVLILAIILIILTVVLGIRAIVKHFTKTAPAGDVAVTVAPDTADEPPGGKEDEPSDIAYDGSLSSYDETINKKEFDENGRVLVAGIPLWEGYEVKPSSSYYITSENTQSEYAVLINARTGEIVCQKECYARINPASMTKILTVLVAAEHISKKDLDTEIAITPENTYYAYKNDLSAVGYLNDEKATVRDLFYGTILESGADAAIALAEYVAGDEESFVEMMNDKLKELGISETTHFTNCVGLYDEDHYSTCNDMAVILKAAVENEFCYDVLHEHVYEILPTEQHPDGIVISNWFLRRIEDKDTKGEVLCAKTGYVHQSGSCAASFSKQNDGEAFFCVTAKAHSAWRCIYDHVDILANNT